jgi:hypothetical protein
MQIEHRFLCCDRALTKPIAEDHYGGCDYGHGNRCIRHSIANATTDTIDCLRKSCPVLHCNDPFLNTTLKVIIV